MNETDYLDTEEQGIIGSLEKDGWESTGNLENWKTVLSRTATNTLAKDHRMNIRITKNDLDGIN